jgi:hypothetical protein
VFDSFRRPVAGWLRFEKSGLAAHTAMASFLKNALMTPSWLRFRKTTRPADAGFVFCETQKPGIAVASFCRACRQSLRWLRFEKLPDEDDFALKIRVASFSQNHRDR